MRNDVVHALVAGFSHAIAVTCKEAAAVSDARVTSEGEPQVDRAVEEHIVGESGRKRNMFHSVL